MLNFDNARMVTQKMSDVSNDYLETLFQKLLDKGITFHNRNNSALKFAVKTGGEIKEILDIILDDKEYSVFEEIFFNFANIELNYNCYGEISFDYCSEPDKNSPLFRLIDEFLLKNGFRYSDSPLPRYTICIKDVPSSN